MIYVIEEDKFALYQKQNNSTHSGLEQKKNHNQYNISPLQDLLPYAKVEMLKIHLQFLKIITNLANTIFEHFIHKENLHIQNFQDISF